MKIVTGLCIAGLPRMGAKIAALRNDWDSLLHKFSDIFQLNSPGAYAASTNFMISDSIYHRYSVTEAVMVVFLSS